VALACKQECQSKKREREDVFRFPLFQVFFSEITVFVLQFSELYFRQKWWSVCHRDLLLAERSAPLSRRNATNNVSLQASKQSVDNIIGLNSKGRTSTSHHTRQAIIRRAN